MGLKSDFNDADVKRYLDKKKKAFEKALIDRLAIVGEQFIADARSELSRWKYIEVGAKKTASTSSLNQDIFYRNGKKYKRSPGGGESFSDWTSNLRNSIGYAIYHERRFIAGDFEGGTGGAAAKAKAQSVALVEGICIVFVAGMNYARAVEAKGYDVITGSAQDAIKSLRNSLKRLMKKKII